jgi:hypothetical protein
MYCPKGLIFTAYFEVVPPQWKIQNFMWNQAHCDQPIGNGYVAKPSIPKIASEFTGYYTQLTDEMPFSLKLYGPGTPNEQEVKFSWVKFQAVDHVEVRFNNYWNPIKASVNLNGVDYYWLFYGGNGGFVINTGYDVTVSWGICYDGPFLNVRIELAEKLPSKWKSWISIFRKDLENIVCTTFDPCIQKPWLPQCLEIEYATAKIGKAAIEMKEMPVPENLEELHNEIIEDLKQINIELADCSLLLKQLRRNDSKEKGIELRTAIADRFGKTRILAFNIDRYFYRYIKNIPSTRKENKKRSK